MGGGGHLASSGRGGAGNMVDSTKSPRIQPQDLQTPTLKTSVVTTGRGGSGNMAKNVDAAETRARQDVLPVTRRESQGAQHSGRGGAGNVFSGAEADQARQAVEDGRVLSDDKEKKDGSMGLAAKGRAFLGLSGKKDESK